MIVDGHLDISWNALAEGRGFERPAAPGYLVSRESLTSAGVGLIFATIFTLPRAGARSQPGMPNYQTAREANILGRLLLGYYQSIGLRLVRSKQELHAYRRAWKPGEVAAVLLMENADPIETPAQVGEWAKLGVRIIGPAWMRTRYCGGTHGPGGLTPAGRKLLRAMQEHALILDLSHMADRSWRDSLAIWRGPLIATHGGARTLCPGQRQFADEMVAEIGRRDGIVGISFYRGHLRKTGNAGVSDIVRHAVHYAHVTGDPRHVALGSDLDGGFGKAGAAFRSMSDHRALRSALTRNFGAADADGIMGGNWLRFLANSLP